MLRARPTTILLVIGGLLFVLAIVGFRHLSSRPPRSPAESPPAEFVGQQVCATCHQTEQRLWLGSHHQLAMQAATDATVLGDFANAEFEAHGVTSRFYRHGEKFMVRTEDAEGNMADFEVAYTFGVTPLQQYLVPFPQGRWQVLPICWDSRPADQGGGRWFHIYGQERITPDDPLYWTKSLQNWNYMCAECHSTDLQKNFQLANNSYETTFEEINVACEACHGPGSQHVAWAKEYPPGSMLSPAEDPRFPNKGLATRLKESDPGLWGFVDDSGTAKRSKPHDAHDLMGTCARCHARRSVLHNDYQHGRPFLDTHLPALLTDPLYYADGQIQDEVYEYGSFLQSKMCQAGVRCTDCHDAHTAKIHTPGNALCARCHLATKYDQPSHHFHPANSTGAQCVECHMPTRTYMVVDPRRDHSIRVPRPDLSLKIGTPNACNQCHTDRSAQWADAAMDQWYGTARKLKTHYGEIIHAARTGAKGAAQSLVQLSLDTSLPGIRRATALSMLEEHSAPSTSEAIQRGLQDPESLVRLAAARALSAIPESNRMRVGRTALQDSILAVRLEAARSLASLSPQRFSSEERQDWERSVAEYIESQNANSDQAGAHLNLGLLHLDLRRPAQAESAYRTALQVDPEFYQAYINLADLYRLQQRERDAESLLRKAIELRPNQAEAYYALGLLQVRTQRYTQAVPLFEKAAELAPHDAHLVYVYAVAVDSIGQRKKAIEILEQALPGHPHDIELLEALVAYHREQGNLNAAITYAQRLADLFPQTAGYRLFLVELQQQAASSKQ